MVTAKQPRVAAIGLDDSQLESIRPLCGELRAANSLEEYLNAYSWTETDILIAADLTSHIRGPSAHNVDPSINLLALGDFNFHWSDQHPDSYGMGHFSNHFAFAEPSNTERELSATTVCSDVYEPLAKELAVELAKSRKPPTILKTTRLDLTPLITTTSGNVVALKMALPEIDGTSLGVPSRPIALLLPKVSNLDDWFRAFLTEVHQMDPVRVPLAPPRLGNPSEWHTPQERALSDKISEINATLTNLNSELGQRDMELAAEAERADKGIRRALWADGDDLTSAAKEILSDLGFAVRDMDAELAKGEPKHEDLRLTLPSAPDWEAIVEVKGYPNSTKTSDARQIREYRERYISEERRPPDLTVWLANPFRNLEPSSRPVPDSNVKDTAEAVGALHVLVPDLYRQWALVEAERLDRQTVIDSLVNAEPGLWVPPVPLGGT